MTDNKGTIYVAGVVNIGAEFAEATGSVSIHGLTGKTLLRIEADGTVTGEIEDAGEAAAAFVDALRTQLAPQVGGDNTASQLYANEAAGDAMIAEYLSGVGLDQEEGEITAQLVVDVAYGAVKAYRVGSSDPALRLPHPRSLTPEEQ